MSTEGVVGGVFVSVVFLVLAVLILTRARALGPALILLGLVTAMAAVCYGAFGSTGVRTTVVSGPGRPGDPAEVSAAFALGSAGPAGPLMKVAVILVLAGVAASLIGLWAPAAAPPRPEEPRHGP